MANAAPAVAFPAPEIFEATFWMRPEFGNMVKGCVRRSDPEFPIEYRLFQRGPPIGKADEKGAIFYGQKYNRGAQGHYELDVQQSRVVIKVVKKSWLEINPRENIMSEIHVAQAHGDNVHIGSILEALEDNEHYYIIMPRLGYDLCDYLQANGPQPNAPPEVTRSSVENLQVLKRLGILHYDISPENIIQCENGGYFLIDFAMAKQCARDGDQFLPVALEIPPKTNLGKPPYVSPEVRQIGIAAEKAGAAILGNLCFGVDMWAIGCTLFLLWTGRYLYETPGDACWDYFVLNDVRSEVIQNERVKAILLLFQGLSQQQQNLLKRIFIHNPEDRVTVDDILNDPYFTPVE